MKKALLLSIILFAIATIGEAQKSQSQIYFIKSGYAKYKYSGNTSGTRELWWDDYGQKSCEVEKTTTTTKMFGMKNTSHTNKLTIVDNGTIWSVNYEDNVATKTNVPLYKGKPMNEMSEKEQKELADKTLAQLGGRRLGNENVMGYDCEVIKLLGSKAWTYKNVTIKSEAKIMGMKVTQEAEEFKPNAKVSASKFVPPGDVKYKEQKHKVDLSNLMQSTAEAQQKVVSEESQKSDLKESNENIDIIPTKYPHEQFLTKIDAFDYDGYAKMVAQYDEGTNYAMFMKGFSSSIIVTITSSKNGDPSRGKNFTKFKHNGKTYMYGKDKDKETEKEASYLVQEDSKFESYIITTILPSKSKEEMLVIADKLNL